MHSGVCSTARWVVCRWHPSALPDVTHLASNARECIQALGWNGPPALEDPLNSSLPLADFRHEVQQAIDSALSEQRALVTPVGPESDQLLDAIAQLLSGGKRFRALFCYQAYKAAGGTHDHAAVRVGAALEFFQGAALIHDDVMDDSAVRRGAPAAHVAFAQAHREAGWERSPERFGLSGAVLAGDLCLVASEQLFLDSGLPLEELDRARIEFNTMRSQLMAGQWLEFVISNRGWKNISTAERIEQARKVVQFKSAKYSIEQPALIGADAAGINPTDRELLSRYGLAVGEAFQLRDDVLGVFGNPETTGKPAGDDLREGKRTVLLALALDAASPEETHFLASLIGEENLTSEQVERAREIFITTGAMERHETMIRAGAQTAHEALAATTELTVEGKAELAELIHVATERNT
ncbi:polyprenyl synthetase family protein [Dermatophilus congolensis]|nr:polyprenyl synthetase family protein [Dermatophilus congolensis]MBO3152008.1 polyprenyl synthetase family protein [Dermatophilus congolensis]MBO3160983.1 polyprenyl synthetase family protein [Dermatophilus congolensis]MBO3163293.1 polyprenyl synthetase family protein [Dermatophilus congolensis]MBO3176850.1 polyprenyl synthetase family protein [Dermatophilus congolensis]